MPLWGFRWFKLFLNPYADDDFEHINVRLNSLPLGWSNLMFVGIRQKKVYLHSARRSRVLRMVMGRSGSRRRVFH